MGGSCSSLVLMTGASKLPALSALQSWQLLDFLQWSEETGIAVSSLTCLASPNLLDVWQPLGASALLLDAFAGMAQLCVLLCTPATTMPAEMPRLQWLPLVSSTAPLPQLTRLKLHAYMIVPSAAAQSLMR